MPWVFLVFLRGRKGRREEKGKWVEITRVWEFSLRRDLVVSSEAMLNQLNPYFLMNDVYLGVRLMKTKMDRWRSLV